jgi:peroxiredoxin
VRTCLSLLTLVILAGCAAAAPPTQDSSRKLALVHFAVPAVELLTLDNEAARLDAVRGGKVALVSFWATWCDACAKEFDALNRLDERASERGGVVIGVAVGEPRERAAGFVKSHQLRYRQLVDEQFKLVDALGQRRVPTTLVIDRDGRVVFSGGALDDKALAAFREALRGPG